MINIYKWIVKHLTLVLYLLPITECAIVMAAMISADISRGPVLALCALILLINYFGINFCYSRVIHEILSQRRGGDHNYAIALSDEILATKQPPTIRTLFIINKCIFLRDMGQLHTALDILLDVDLNENPPLYKFLCYNNISDIYVLLKNADKAEEYRLMACEAYDSMPEGKTKDMHSHTPCLSQAEILVLKGEYHAAIECLETLEDRENIPGYHSIMAEALIGLGDKEEARKHYDKMLEMGLSDVFTQKLSREL